MPPLSKHESRDTILRAARAEFAAYGFAGARVDRIAKTAGLNKQLIYYYFGSKQALHTAAMCVPPGSQLEQANTTTAADTVRQIVEGLVRTLAAHPEIVSVLVDRTRTPDGAQAAREWVRRLEGDAAAALSRGQGLGHFRDDLDPRATGRAAVVLCLGFLALAPHFGTRLDEWATDVRDFLVRVTAW